MWLSTKKMVKSRPIKIMRIIARMNVGGPAIQITNILNGLPPQEFEQRLYFGSCEAGEVEFISEISGQTRLHRIPGFRRSIGVLSELGVFLHLVREMKCFKPDIIHTHTAKAGLLGRVAAMISGSCAKRVHTFHGHVLHGYFNPLISALYALVERMLAHYTDIIISVGSEVQADLLEYRIGWKCEHRVILPGIQVSARIAKGDALKQLELPSKKLTISFVGRFTPIKRIDRIVEVARLCKRERLDVQFVLAGEGSEFEKIRDTAALESLPMVFLGWRFDVEKILSASDVLILTSDNEGTPIASIQASLLGIPTLATNVGSLQDVVIDGKTGLLTSNNVDDIFSALERLYVEQDLANKLGRGAKNFAEKEFSLKRFLDDYRQLYLSLVP
jgi:glycosyltransferase involved in cell wall biosynthesis